MELTTENVKTVFEKCITESESSDSTIIAGPVHTFMMSGDKLKEEEENIYSMLKQLPDEFMQSGAEGKHFLGGGGGMSFLNACMRKDGVQWGEHYAIEMLLVLGFGIKKTSYCLPRDMWSVLPGGMPYFVVK